MKKNSLFMWIPLFLIFVIILEKKPEEKKINVAILNGPSCIPISFMMEENSNSTKSKYVFEKFANPQTVLPKMVKNEIDIAFMPLNVAAKAYNLSEKIKCVAICGNGNLSLVTKDANIKQFSDIKDKEVYVAGQGSTPEYMFLYLLNQNGIKANLNFSVPTANIPSYLIENQIDYAVLPEPFATIATNKDSNLKKAIDLQEEFKKFNKEFENGSYLLNAGQSTIKLIGDNLARESREWQIGITDSYLVYKNYYPKYASYLLKIKGSKSISTSSGDENHYRYKDN